MQNLVNKKLQLNKFEHVELPKNKVLFTRVTGLKVPKGSSEVPVADFTSRNLESISQAERLVSSEYHDYLRASQMPLDTDTSDASEKPVEES